MKKWMAAPAGSWKAVATQKRVFALNLMAVPAFLGGFWAWLYIPVSSIPLVIFAVVLLCVIGAGMLLLVSYTFDSYYMVHHPMRAISSQGIHLPPTPVLKRAVSSLPAVVLWFGVFGACCMTVTWMNSQSLEWSKPISSWLTMATQKPVSFYEVNGILEKIFAVVQWLLLPLVFFASFAGLAVAALRKGNRGMWQRHSLGMLKNPLYWVAWVAFVAAGILLPVLLVGWVPSAQGIPLATLSMVLRFGLAYILFLLSWLLFLSALARLLKKPKESVIVFRRPLPGPA